MSDRTPPDPQQVIQRSLGDLVVAGKAYHTPLDATLAPWYCYTLDGGHSILVVVSNKAQARWPGEDVEDYLAPAPVRLVQRLGVTERDGYLWCDLPYDDTLGILAAPEDDEY